MPNEDDIFAEAVGIAVRDLEEMQTFTCVEETIRDLYKFDQRTLSKVMMTATKIHKIINEPKD